MYHHMELRMLFAWDWAHGLQQKYHFWHPVALSKPRLEAHTEV